MKSRNSSTIISMCGGDSSAKLARLFFRQANTYLINKNIVFRFYSDGSLSETTRQILIAESDFDIEFPDEQQVLECLNESLSQYSSLSQLSKKTGIYPPIRKLLHIPLHASQSQSRFVFFDTDIIFINSTDITRLFEHENGFIFMKDRRSFYFLSDWQKVLAQVSLKTSLPLCLNSGITAYNLSYYDLDYLEYLARKYNTIISETPWSIEQTLVMLMAAKHPIYYIHPSNLRIPDDADSHELLASCNALHFTGNVRHRIPEILSIPNNKESSNKFLSLVESQRISTPNLSKNIIKNSFRKKVNRLRWYLQPLGLGRMRKLISK